MLDGTYNFRDVGGMPLAGGGTTRSGILYRSDALSGLTPTGLEQLAATDIGAIVDFRTAAERQMAPDRLPASRPFDVVELSLLEGAMTGFAQQAMHVGVAGGDPDAAAAAVRQALAELPSLGHVYVSMLEHGAAAFAQAARRIARHPPAGVLMHCTAGKDRTGVAIAVILDTVGTDRGAIVADYASSAANLEGAWAEEMYRVIGRMGIPLTSALRSLVSGTPAAAIEQALAFVDEQGGSAAYLRSGGTTNADLRGMRDRLVG